MISSIEDRVKFAIPVAKLLAQHEIDYVNDQSLSAPDRFLSKHGTYLKNA